MKKKDKARGIKKVQKKTEEKEYEIEENLGRRGGREKN